MDVAKMKALVQCAEAVIRKRPFRVEAGQL